MCILSGKVKLDITASTQTLKTLLGQQRTASGKERVQAVYLLRTKQVETVQHLAVVLGRNRVTVQRWLSQYRSGGLERLLEVGKSTGRTPLIPAEAVERLKQELLEPSGFSSYEEVRLWLAAELGIQVKYDVVQNLVDDKLKADLKVARPKSSEQEPGTVENFKKELPQKLICLMEEAQEQSKKLNGVRYWCGAADAPAPVKMKLDWDSKQFRGGS